MRRGENFDRALARRVQPARASLQSHLSLVTGPPVVPEAARVARPKPVVLLILDGWGHRDDPADNALAQADLPNWRSEEHTSELQSLMRISYAVFCLKKKKHVSIIIRS